MSTCEASVRQLLARPFVRRLAITVAVCLLAGGCSRDHFRLQADKQVKGLIDSAAHNPQWPLKGYTIYPSPKSRMFAPGNPDYPPMPPDDPTSHQLMHCVDCKPGAPCWHCSGDTPFVENPDWKMYVPLGDDGRWHLDLRGAVSAAFLNSPDYQDQVEELYLSALDVTFERFRFDTQFFGGYESFLTGAGRNNPSAPSNLNLSTRDIQAQKLFATGGELVVGLANSLIWEFSGPDRHSALTLLDFTLFQPLLRGAGRARVLERLTITERALLANVRQMQRFRRGFYAEIRAGINSGRGPSRRGGLGGGAGLEGFTGVGAGGFGRLGAITTGGATGTGAAQAGGYMGLLQDAQEIRNLEANVAALRSSLAELQAKYEAGGRIDFFQVELARQALYNAQSRLLTRRTAFASSLDGFKIDLGLPPDTPIELCDPMLERFNLIDTELSEAQSYAADLLNRIRDPDLDLTEDTWHDLLSDSDELFEMVDQQIGVARRDLKRFEENLPRRRTNLDELSERPEVQSSEVDAAAFSVSRLDENFDKGVTFLEEISRVYATASGEFEVIVSPNERNKLIDVLTQMNELLGDLLLLQARAKLEAVTLTPVNLEPQKALNVASQFRLDWMNARASLVDAWRLIDFNANDLKSDLNLVFSGEVRNVGDNPLNLQGNAGRLRVGVEFDAPLTRLVERNNFRQSLLEYQQARRNYYTFRDRVSQGLRDTLRNVRLNQLNFEMRRAAAQLAISQVELARLQLEEPPKPDTQVGGFDNRVQNLVNALTQLLEAQNDFLSIWVNYEVLRLALDFQLGTMRLDADGQWIDPGEITAATLPLLEKMAPETLID